MFPTAMPFLQPGTGSPVPGVPRGGVPIVLSALPSRLLPAPTWESGAASSAASRPAGITVCVTPVWLLALSGRFPQYADTAAPVTRINAIETIVRKFFIATPTLFKIYRAETCFSHKTSFIASDGVASRPPPRLRDMTRRCRPPFWGTASKLSRAANEDIPPQALPWVR